MTEWEMAPEVETIARRVIANVQAHYDLRRPEVPIVYVFRDEAATSMGRTVLGRARRISGLNAFLITDGQDAELFVIEIAKDKWDELTPAQREALVDHELSHCRVDTADDGTLKLKMRGHDVEEFVGIVDRHGLWKTDLELLGTAAAEQLSMALDRELGDIEGSA